MQMSAGRNKERALTTAIAAGLVGLPASAVDAPPAPPGTPEGRGFARALGRATAPPSEASPIQGAPPPEEAVASPAGDASHEAGTAASTHQGPLSAPDADAEEEVPASMPDRPAGAVEGELDADVLDASTLEAMVAAVLFRPMPEPEMIELASGLPLVEPQAGLRPSVAANPPLRSAEAVLAIMEAVTPLPIEVALMSLEVSGVPPLEVALLIPNGGLHASKAARLVAGAADAGDALLRSDDVDLANAPVPNAEAVVAAIQVAATSVPRMTPTRSTAAAELPGAGAALTFEGDLAVVTVEATAGSMAPTAAPVAAPRETASSPLSLLEGVRGDEAASTSGPVARTDAADGAGDQVESTRVESISGRPALVSSPTPPTDVRTTSVAAAKVSAVQSMPVATQVAETVHAAVLHGDHEIRLLLNPGDLGRIDIRITEQGGVLRLHLHASHGATRDLLAREMPALQQALEARDLRVERIHVSHSGFPSADASGAAWQQGSGREGQQRERDGSPAWSPVANLAQADGSQREAGRAPRIIRHHGTLDRVA